MGVASVSSVAPLFTLVGGFINNIPPVGLRIFDTGRPMCNVTGVFTVLNKASNTGTNPISMQPNLATTIGSGSAVPAYLTLIKLQSLIFLSSC